MLNALLSVLILYSLGMIAAILFGRFYNSYVIYRNLPNHRRMPGTMIFLSWLTPLLVIAAVIIDLIDSIKSEKFLEILNKLVKYE